MIEPSLHAFSNVKPLTNRVRNPERYPSLAPVGSINFSALQLEISQSIFCSLEYKIDPFSLFVIYNYWNYSEKFFLIISNFLFYYIEFIFITNQNLVFFNNIYQSFR